MTCEDFRSDYLEESPAPETHDHMATCSDCRRMIGQFDELRTLLHEPGTWESPRTGLEDAVVAAIMAGDVPAVTPGPDRARSGRIHWIWPVAAAAVVAVGILVGSFGAGGPDWRLVIPGTERAPQASAIVEGWDTPAGTRLRVSTDGLPPAPDGHVYELWFTREREHVSAGSFVEADGVEMLVGISQDDYPRVWITLETLDGDTSPNWDQNLVDTGA